MFEEISVPTQNRYQLVDITDKVEKVVEGSKIKDGLVLVFAPHSTAAILLAENEQGLKDDFSEVFKRLVSEHVNFNK